MQTPVSDDRWSFGNDDSTGPLGAFAFFLARTRDLRAQWRHGLIAPTSTKAAHLARG